jgi:hypothetical protein
MTLLALDFHDDDGPYASTRGTAFERAGFARVTHWSTTSRRGRRFLAVHEADGEATAVTLADGEILGPYAPTGSLPTPREGAARGLLLGLVDPGEVTDAELERFYDEVHAREVIDSGLYLGARRFRAVTGASPRFVTLYETEGEEPATLRAFVVRGGTTPMPEWFVVRSVTTWSRR